MNGETYLLSPSRCTSRGSRLTIQSPTRPSAKLLLSREWSPHAATWIAWPHHEPDWPGKLGAIVWAYAEIARVLAEHEAVEILCHDEEVRRSAQEHLAAHGVVRNVRLHVVPNDRVWLRDSAPTFVRDDAGRIQLVNWGFNAWAKYPNFALDAQVGSAIARITGLPRVEPVRPDDGTRLVLEGGGIETDGEGTLRRLAPEARRPAAAADSSRLPAADG